jgi:hypothetical protein
MSVLDSIVPILELAPALAGLTAALLTFASTRKTLRYKRTLRRVALQDRFVKSELVKYYRDRDLSEGEVRSLVRAIERAIERDLKDASGDLELRLRGARALALDEVETKGHRLFKELAAEASDEVSQAA